MPLIRTEFGYYPQILQVRAGPITIDTLPNLEQKVSAIEADQRVVKDWIYAPLETQGGTATQPYPHRVFGLPKTHVIEHAAADSDDHVAFLLWALIAPRPARSN